MKMSMTPSEIEPATFRQSGWQVSCSAFEPATFPSQKRYCVSQIALSGSVFDEVVRNTFITIRFINTVFCFVTPCRLIGA